jgi:hypothetical protein
MCVARTRMGAMQAMPCAHARRPHLAHSEARQPSQRRRCEWLQLGGVAHGQQGQVADGRPAHQSGAERVGREARGRAALPEYVLEPRKTLVGLDTTSIDPSTRLRMATQGAIHPWRHQPLPLTLRQIACFFPLGCVDIVGSRASPQSSDRSWILHPCTKTTPETTPAWHQPPPLLANTPFTRTR